VQQGPLPPVAYRQVIVSRQLWTHLVGPAKSADNPCLDGLIARHVQQTALFRSKTW